MIYLNDCGVVCGLGNTREAVSQSVLAGQTAVQSNNHYKPYTLPLATISDDWIKNDKIHLPLSEDSRNNHLAIATLEQMIPTVQRMIECYGKNRIAVIIGTSTSGIAEAEQAMRTYKETGEFRDSFDYAQQRPASVAHCVAHYLGVTGPTYVHSSACASGAKALAAGARLLNMGICDAVIAGGVDTLSAFVIGGFCALESCSDQVCQPMSVNRKGINLGEAGALFVMSREKASVALSGWGETSDAYHISAPNPAGLGAITAIKQALSRANVSPQKVDYINMHGTATKQNDQMESLAIATVFGQQVPVSSTKPLTGHTLGAAGALEAAICWILMQDNNPTGYLAPHIWDKQYDTTLSKIRLVQKQEELSHYIQHAVSHSFAFGGSNAVLVFSRK